jgi:hypothetical protein
MKKIFITILLLFPVSVLPQDENPNVELPDFVIMGKDVISVRRVDKLPPDFISTVSDDYLKPTYRPEQLETVDISNPVEGELSLLDSADYKKGFIDVKAGRYQLPAGELNYVFPFTNGSLHGIVKGLNQLKYVDNSNRNFLSGQLDFNISVPTDGKFLPGTKFSLNGNHNKKTYKFFGSSIDPEKKRTLNVGNISLGIQNLYIKEFVFDVNTGSDFTYLNDEEFNESLFYLNGFGRLKLSDFSLGVDAKYQYQSLTTDSLKDHRLDYFFIRPTIALEILNKVMVQGGITFASAGDEEFFNLYGSLIAELAKNMILLAEFSPEAVNMTAGNFLQNNFYYDQQNLTRIFIEKKNKLRATVKYEFETYYQIDGGIEYFTTDNLSYYVNPDQEGFFAVTTSEAKSFDVFLNLLYHLGPFGYFYGSFDYISVKNSESKRIPYYPGLKASLIYGYDFSEQWRAEAKFSYLSDRYADIENQRKLESIFDLGFKLTFSLQRNFAIYGEIQNLFNNKRDFWESYQQKPFEVLMGINFFFD